ncbi:MAG: hypothetical protein Q7R41_12800, partial [Phycisphaerales bacterium]|nr:hypothetical protein [Phycisphaerales bacterium]
SRITGELVPDGMNVVSAAEVFALASNSETYTRIRDAAFAGFVDAVEKGIIAERPFVSFDSEEGERIAYRPPRQRAKVAPPVAVPAEVPSPKNLTSKKLSEDIAKPAKPTGRNIPIAEQIAEMNRSREEKGERVVWMESRITWRRVIAALKRIGVSIDVRGAHPKLQYGTKTTRYLNAHEADPATNKHELYRVLRELDIARDTFFAQLK